MVTTATTSTGPPAASTYCAPTTSLGGAAALSKSPSLSVVPQPLIQTVTMNGFTILDDTETPVFEQQQRRFLVVSPEGERHEVLVEIATEPFEYVQRMTGRQLAPDNSFWTMQARRLLSDFLWNEGKVPTMHRLVMTHFDPDKLPVAARWRA